MILHNLHKLFKFTHASRSTILQIHILHSHGCRDNSSTCIIQVAKCMSATLELESRTKPTGHHSLKTFSAWAHNLKWCRHTQGFSDMKSSHMAASPRRHVLKLWSAGPIIVLHVDFRDRLCVHTSFPYEHTQGRGGDSLVHRIGLRLGCQNPIPLSNVWLYRRSNIHGRKVSTHNRPTRNPK